MYVAFDDGTVSHRFHLFRPTFGIIPDVDGFTNYFLQAPGDRSPPDQEQERKRQKPVYEAHC